MQLESRGEEERGSRSGPGCADLILNTLNPGGHMHVPVRTLRRQLDTSELQARSGWAQTWEPSKSRCPS